MSAARFFVTCAFIWFPLFEASLLAQPLQTWTQWRGPNRDGTITGVDWPDTLSKEQLTQLWRVELGPSYSGPIVVDDHVFVTETKDKKFEVVRALNRKTGKQLWEAKWEGALSVPFFAKSNGDWIRATPVYDEGRLFVPGMRDVLVCLDGKTGKEIWRIDFVKETRSDLPAFGFVCSPLVVGDFLYVQAGASFVKVDKTTGKIVWRTLKDGGGMYGSAFSSPYRATLAGVDQILVQTREKLAGVNPENGEVFWQEKIPAFRGMNILTPATIGDSVFTSTYGGKTLLFDVAKEEGRVVASQRWASAAQGYMSSPVVIDEYCYVHLKNRRFTCIEAATGEEKWRTTPFGQYWSMAANGDKILALDERGELLLIRANPKEFELLGRATISDDPTWAHVAICGDVIYIRELNAMTVWRWKEM